MAVWYALRHVVGVETFVLPMPHEIASAIARQRSLFLHAAWQTTHAAMLGFGSAAVVAGGFAMLLGSSRWMKHALYPYLLMLQMTPLVVTAPLIVLWLGRGLHSIVVVTFIVSFFPVVVNTTHGMASTDRNLVELFALYRANWWQRLLLLRLPYASPFYFAGLRIAATLAPIGAIFGEYVTGSVAGGTGGLGFLTYVFNSRQDRAELMGVGVTACSLGLVFLAVISMMNRLLLRRWHESILRGDV